MQKINKPFPSNSVIPFLYSAKTNSSTYRYWNFITSQEFPGIRLWIHQHPSNSPLWSSMKLLVKTNQLISLWFRLSALELSSLALCPRTTVSPNFSTGLESLNWSFFFADRIRYKIWPLFTIPAILLYPLALPPNNWQNFHYKILSIYQGSFFHPLQIAYKSLLQKEIYQIRFTYIWRYSSYEILPYH